ncbi:MAG: choice-of-anchor D domain-containing protein [Myxococcota bacterium]
MKGGDVQRRLGAARLLLERVALALFSAATAFLTTACGGAADLPMAAGSTNVTLDRTTIGFGEVMVGTVVAERLVVRNLGSAAARVELDLTGSVVNCQSPEESPFCVRGPFPGGSESPSFTLAAGAEQPLVVEFRPMRPGSETGRFVLRVCDGSEACTLPVLLFALAGPPALQCSPPALDFEVVNPGECKTSTVSCWTSLREPLDIEVGIGGNSGPDFSVPEPTRRTLEPGSEGFMGPPADFRVEYCPETLGDDAGVFLAQLISDELSQRPFEVPLQGSGGGPNIAVSPSQINFGLTSLLAPSKRTVIFSNTKAKDGVLEVIGEDLPSFLTIEPEGPIPFPAGQSVTLSFHLDRSAVQPGLYVASILFRITYEDGEVVENELRVRMEFASPPPCHFELVPRTLDFGLVPVAEGRLRSLTLRNLSSTARCLIGDAGFTPETDESFTLLDDPAIPRTLNPGDITSLLVEFRPKARGPREGQLELSINNPDEPLVIVNLLGAGWE